MSQIFEWNVDFNLNEMLVIQKRSYNFENNESTITGKFTSHLQKHQM